MTDPLGGGSQGPAEAFAACLLWLIITAAVLGLMAGVAYLVFRLLT